MKKITRNVLSAFACAALVCAAVSCSDGGSDPVGSGQDSSQADSLNDIKGKSITFDVNAASVGTGEEVKFFLKYDRTAAGADEGIIIKNPNILVTLNGQAVAMPKTTVEFPLDEYGSSFSGAEGQITDENDRKEYKAKISLGKTLKVGDKVTFQFKYGEIAGAGKGKIKASGIQVALIDTNEHAGNGYYKELSATEYVPLADEEAATTTTAGTSTGTGTTAGAAAEGHGLLSASVDLTWDAGATVTADKLADATENTKFVVTYTSNDDNDYHTFKMRVVNPEQELFEGTETGISIDRTSTSADALHGCSFVTAPSANPATFSYTPSAAEWAALKAGGFNIYGYGAKITKIELAN